MWRVWIFAVAVCATTLCAAQQVQTDPAPFRRPAFFVLPRVPTAVLAEHGQRNYVLTVDVDRQGHVTSLRSLTPDDEEFRAHLAEVMPHWMFYPRVDPVECLPTGSEARIDLQYPKAGEPRVWLEFDPMAALMKRPSPVAIRAAAMSYSGSERYEYVEGRVIVAASVLPDGTVSRRRLVLALHAPPGLVDSALAHSKSMIFEPGTAPTRCALINYPFGFQ
jgi:hypothetical protein